MGWRASHGIWYGLADIAWYMVMVWQARHGARHSIWYGLAGMSLYIVWPGGQGMVYVMAWWVRHDIWHGICYGMAGITLYMVRPGGHRMVYRMVWRGMSWYVKRHIITCFKALPRNIVSFTRGVDDVSWRSCSYVPDPFTNRRPFTCMFRSHVQLLITLGRDSK